MISKIASGGCNLRLNNIALETSKLLHLMVIFMSMPLIFEKKVLL